MWWLGVRIGSLVMKRPVRTGGTGIRRVGATGNKTCGFRLAGVLAGDHDLFDQDQHRGSCWNGHQGSQDSQ